MRYNLSSIFYTSSVNKYAIKLLIYFGELLFRYNVTHSNLEIEYWNWKFIETHIMNFEWHLLNKYLLPTK